MKNRQVNQNLIKLLKHLWFACLFFLCPFYLSAQNLVFNGSFEENYDRPKSQMYNREIYLSKGWNACCPYSNDLCSSTDYYYYPNYYEEISWVLPKRPFEGNYFIGLLAYDIQPPDWPHVGKLFREYASGVLSKPLEIGKKYKLSLAHTNGQFSGEQKTFGHNGFGVLLSTYRPIQKGYFSRLEITPQFRTPYLLSDSIWKIMHFEFVADSAYTNITLGNFYSIDNISVEIYKSVNISYVFIDDIKIEEIADTPKLPQAITLCKPDSLYIENKEKKLAEWWVNGKYLGWWSEGIKYYYSDTVNQIVMKYYNDYDTTYIYVKNKPKVVLKQNGYLCPWSDKKGYLSYSTDEKLTSYYWQLPNEKVLEPELKLKESGIVSFIYNSPKHCEWKQDIETKDTCPEIRNCLIPNAFSPNNDGLNDNYKADCENIIDFELRIFNRWGELIFFTKNSKEEWDGTYKDKKCPDGIYAALIKITYPTDKGFYYTESSKVSLTLIR